MQQPYRFTTDRQLARHLFEQDRSAFHYLYDKYAAGLYGLILGRVPDEAIARDLLVKVFVRVWQDIDLYNPDTHRIFTWLLVITNKMVIEHTGNHIDTIVGDLLAGITKDKF